MKILIMRIGRLGDMIMVTPAVNAILNHFPEAEIHLLTSTEGQLAFRNYHPRITKLFTYRPELTTRYFDAHKVKKLMSEHQYDYTFSFDTKQRHNELLPKAPHIARIQPHSGPDILHYSQRCLDVVKATAPKCQTDYYAHLPIQSKMQEEVDALLQQHGIDKNTTVIGLHPTFSQYKSKFNSDAKRHRMWPVQHFGEFAKRLTAQAKEQGTSLSIIMDLLPSEKPLGEEIVAASDNTITLLSLPPKFERYKALLKRMDLFIAGNTGPMHMAAALNTPVIALFSQFSPKDCGPFMEPNKYIALCAENTPHPEQGLAAISVDEVMSAAKNLVSF